MRLATVLERPSTAVRPRLTLGLLSAQHALIHAQSALLPLVFIQVAAAMRVGPADGGVLLAASSIGGGLIQLTFGPLTRIASRRAILGVGGLVFGACMSALATASSWLPFFGATLAARLGAAPQHAVGNALLAEQFPADRRGFAISTHIALANLIPVTVPLAGGWLIANLGWQSAALAIGLPALVVGAAILLFVGESGADRASAIEAGSTRTAFRAVARERDLRWLFAASSVAAAGRGQGVLITFLPLYLALQLRLPEGTVNLMYTLLIAGSVPAPMIAGWLSDRVGHKQVLVATYLLGASAVLFLVVAGPNVPLVWLAVGFMGAFVFEESSLLQALLADVARPAIRDVAFSSYFTLMFVVGAVWQALIGAVIGLVGGSAGYSLAFLIMAGSFVAAAIVSLPIRAPTREVRQVAA